MSGLRAVLLPACLALALAATPAMLGCGSDDEPTPTVEPATPTGPAGPAGQRDEGEPREPDPLEDDGGVVAPPPENGQQGQSGPSVEDSPESDVPPRPGSPEEEFERWCDENPDACR